MSSLYNPTVPTGIIELDEDYKNLQNNFQQLSTSFQVNHLPLENNTTSNGAHTFVEMRNQAGLPAGLKTLEGTIYTKQANAVSELFYTPDQSTDQYQLTRTINASTANFSTYLTYPGAAAFELGGWTFLPGGLLMQYGSVLPGEGTSSTGTTKFPVAFTATPYMVLPTPVSRNSGVQSGQERVISVRNGLLTTAQFQWNWENSTSSYVGFNWIAIGK
jgi:hypothetical protein